MRLAYRRCSTCFLIKPLQPVSIVTVAFHNMRSASDSIHSDSEASNAHKKFSLFYGRKCQQRSPSPSPTRSPSPVPAGFFGAAVIDPQEAPEPKRRRVNEGGHSGVEATPLLSEPMLQLESESGNHAVPTDDDHEGAGINALAFAANDLTDDGIDSDEVGAGEIEQVPFLYRNGTITNASLVYDAPHRSGWEIDVMVIPPDYADESLINELMYGKNLYVGRDGSIVTAGDLVYDVQEQKITVLQRCHGHQLLRFHEACFSANKWSIAPVFITCGEEPLFAHDLLLLKSIMLTKPYDHTQLRVGPVAKLLRRALLKLRRKRRMQVITEVARWVPMEAAELDRIMGPFLD